MESKRTKKVRTVVVSRPGAMQQSLRVALTQMPWMKIEASVGDSLSAFKLVESQPPHLLVVDSNLLDEELHLLLREVKLNWPAVHCLVLTQTRRQQKEALAAGADTVLARNSPAEKLRLVLGQIQIAVLAGGGETISRPEF